MQHNLPWGGGGGLRYTKRKIEKCLEEGERKREGRRRKERTMEKEVYSRRDIRREIKTESCMEEGEIERDKGEEQKKGQ